MPSARKLPLLVDLEEAAQRLRETRQTTYRKRGERKWWPVGKYGGKTLYYLKHIEPFQYAYLYGRTFSKKILVELMISVPRAAHHLGVPELTLSHQHHKWCVPHYRTVEGRIGFLTKDLDAWLGTRRAQKIMKGYREKLSGWSE